jgi:tRNA U34 2-thiouridine synthase MnmA/TrmU
MIQQNTAQDNNDNPIKAVGLISGGLDSTLAAKIVKDLGVDVYGVYFAMPWGCCNKTKAIEAAMKIGIKFITLQLDERYLAIVQNPKYGRGTALNPCVDCRIHMFSRAAQYMRHIGGSFVFTGEVLGQRPMSQMRHSMAKIEKGAGLEGYLLRPLCAQLLEPTVPEQKGWIDRSQLLRLNGRSRSEQIELARQIGISEYTQPGGGCLLTDQNFSRRMQDTFDHGYRNFRETVALQWGRHFRLNDEFKFILGRDEEENESLIRFAHPDDYVMRMADNLGPTLILKGRDPTPEILKIAGGLIQRFSRYRGASAQKMKFWAFRDKGNVKKIEAKILDESVIAGMQI